MIPSPICKKALYIRRLKTLNHINDKNCSFTPIRDSLVVCPSLTVHKRLVRNSSDHHPSTKYSKTCVKWPLSKDVQDLSFNAGQKYCRMLQGEHSALLMTFIKLPFIIKIFVLSIFEWPFYFKLLFIIIYIQ